MAKYPFIRVIPAGSRVCVKIEHNLPFGSRRCTHHFVFDANNEPHADLLAHHLEGVLQDAMLRVKVAAYERGYRDGRGHRAKTLPACADLDWEAL